MLETGEFLMAEARELTLQAADGTALFVTDWMIRPPDAARGGVVLTHGLGEHCGRYAHVARFFNECGWSVRAFDHRGHGRSGGPRGDTTDAEAILRDAKLVIDDFARQLPTPPILLGHSMGGLFAARFATGALSPLRGLILSSPALAVPLSGIEKISLKVMGTLAPGIGVPNGVKTQYLSHDPAVELAYINDPLVHGKITARLLGSMLQAIDFSHAHAAGLKTPTLMVVAGDDHLVNASGSAEFFKHLAPGIGKIHLYQNFYHEIFNEVEQRRVFDDIHEWLADR